jgi:5-oxoprolinase (ATP-hydrolysing)
VARTFVDRGGTFTDVVLVEDDGRVSASKVPSDVAVVGELARGALVFGTTVATNALLESTPARVLLVVTPGFADLAWIGDMRRPKLFDPDALRPAPPVLRVVELPGRLDANGGVLEPFADLDDPLDDVDAVAIVLLFGPRRPEVELRVLDQVRARRPDLHVAVGHRLAPELGYVERIETTLLDAAFTPVLRRALLRDRLAPGTLAVRSDASLVLAEDLSAADAALSGPAAGVLAVEAVARAAGFRHAVGLDMGGTSTDVCRVDVGRLPRRSGALVVAGRAVRRPALEVHTIAAGGGSILGNDGVSLTVGPRSAGADPGPMCRGRGGPPTLTDAALLAGLVDPTAFEPPLRADLVQVPGSPDRFLDVAREAMAGAIRALATEKGLSLAGHALVAYGGAAGQHAAAVAERVGIDVVLVHPLAGVLCALGQTLARREEVAHDAVWQRLSDVDLHARFAALRARLPAWDDVTFEADLRRTGTDDVVPIVWTPDVDLATFVARFRAEITARTGLADPSGDVEVVTVRARARDAAAGDLPVVDDDGFGLGGDVVLGPRVLFAPTTSVAVPAGWTARRDRGILRLERVERAVAVAEDARTPHGVALWRARFAAVAEDAGAVLRRLARSTSIKERLDFSCAVFDADGALVASAPHVPVHLGAMGGTVRDLIAAVPDAPDGASYLTNDPAAGGSHLPDLTVVTPVVVDGRRFFLACRGHHVDVGGSTPGSMPTHAARLADEGLVFRRVPLDGDVDWSALLAGCRLPDVVRDDLCAQIAANRHAARALRALGSGALLATWMAHLLDASEQATRARIADLEPGSATDTLDGVPLRVRVDRVGDRVRVDFTGTGGPSPTNRNAPVAVVKAAILYVLAVRQGGDLPLDEGALRCVDLVLPAGSIVDPPPGAAVSGGNVETSQRLVDLVLRATGARAASQGTMNNLTIGGPDWAFYETIGGGLGASPDRDGASGRQVHMTNTRITDPEVLELRLPLRVRRFELRRGSGGAGVRRGGDGLVREIEVLRPCSASLLASWRPDGAPGLDGGAPGSPGHATVLRGGFARGWGGEPVSLAAGDRVCVETPGGGGSGATS